MEEKEERRREDEKKMKRILEEEGREKNVCLYKEGRRKRSLIITWILELSRERREENKKLFVLP